MVIREEILDHSTIFACNVLLCFFGAKFVSELFEYISVIELFYDVSSVFRIYFLWEINGKIIKIVSRKISACVNES